MKGRPCKPSRRLCHPRLSAGGGTAGRRSGAPHYHCWYTCASYERRQVVRRSVHKTTKQSVCHHLSGLRSTVVASQLPVSTSGTPRHSKQLRSLTEGADQDPYLGGNVARSTLSSPGSTSAGTTRTAIWP